jgi:hypothetical protein
MWHLDKRKYFDFKSLKSVYLTLLVVNSTENKMKMDTIETRQKNNKN